MEAEREAQEQTGRDEPTGPKPNAQPRKCKLCQATFPSKKALNAHLVTQHNYLHCPDCTKVFKLQIRLDKHAPKHIQSSQEPAEWTQALISAQTGEVQELTKATVQYLREVGEIMGQRESKSWAFGQMTSQLLSGMAAQPRTGKTLALYMHALEIALSLPIQPLLSSLPSFTSVDLVSSVATENYQGSRGTSYAGTTPESEKQDNLDLEESANKQVCSGERVSISIPISAFAPLLEPEKPVVRGKGLLFAMHEKELRRKRRLKERSERMEEKAEGHKKRKVYRQVPLPVPEVSASVPLDSLHVESEQLPGTVSLICIEEPCSMRFCSASELLAHLEAVHYNYKSCN